MEEESYELTLLIKEVKLSVKFPCRITFQHLGKPLAAEVQSNGSNIFTIEREVKLREQKSKDNIQITIHLATEKGGNIMAGVIRLSLKDITHSEGQTINVALQKCLDSYATCLIYVAHVSLSRSRVQNRKVTFAEQRLLQKNQRNRAMMNTSKSETQSQVPAFEGFKDIKSRLKYQDAESYNKRGGVVNVSSQVGLLKDKPMSTAGFKKGKEQDDFTSRFKHLSKKQEQEGKTLVSGKWRDAQILLSNNQQLSQKGLKMQIVKYRVKFEQSEKTIEQKNSNIKQLKDQISELNRQLLQKNYYIQQIGSKNNQIVKLQQQNKNLSKQMHENRNKLIDIQRQLQQQNVSHQIQISRIKDQYDRREHQIQKLFNQKKQQLRESIQQNSYKNNQIVRIKKLIEDLERNLENKTYQHQKIISIQKNQHTKTKITSQERINHLQAELKQITNQNQQLSSSLNNVEEGRSSLSAALKKTEEELVESDRNLQLQKGIRQKLAEEKKRLEKSEEQLSGKLKSLQKQLGLKERQLGELSSENVQSSNSNKRKINQLLDKNKILNGRIQELQSKTNTMAAHEQKLKRSNELLQKQLKNLSESEKLLVKSNKQKQEKILQLQKDIGDIESKFNGKEGLSKKQIQYKAAQIEKFSAKVVDLQRNLQHEREGNEQKRVQLLKSDNRIKLLEQSLSRVSQQLKDLRQSFHRKEQQYQQKVKQLQQEVRSSQIAQNQLNKQLHNSQMQKFTLRSEISKNQKIIDGLNQRLERNKKKQSDLQATVKIFQRQIEDRQNKLLDLQNELKNVQNQYKNLQADNYKNEKIRNIIAEEKDTAKSDISKLRKEVERREKREEEYLAEIKNLKEQIVKLELRVSNLTKDSQRFRDSISESIKNSFILKKNNYIGDNLSATNLEISRLQKSRIKNYQTPNDYSFISQAVPEMKFAQIIQNYAKQAQSTITSLSEESRNLRKQRERLQKDLFSAINKGKQMDQQHINTIKKFQEDLDLLHSRNSDNVEQFQQKISALQKEISKKDRNIRDLTESLADLTTISQNERLANEMNISDLMSKIDALKGRVTQLSRKDGENAAMLNSLEEKIPVLESNNQQLTSENQILNQQISKKDKLISGKNEEMAILVKEIEGWKKIKSQLHLQLLNSKQNLKVQKESVLRLSSEISEEQSKNKQLTAFNAELLREKQSFLKRDIQKNEKIYELQLRIQGLTVDLAEKNEQFTKKSIDLKESKDLLKATQFQSHNLQDLLSQSSTLLERERQKLKDRQKKLIQKEKQIENLTILNKKNVSQYQGEIVKLNEQLDELAVVKLKQKELATQKIQQLQLLCKKLGQSEKKLSDSIISLQQQLFFERQSNSLNLSRIEQLRQNHSDLQLQIQKLNIDIANLNEELKQKQQNLFALSGKLYNSENKLQIKEEEMKIKCEKIQMDWRCKFQQFCEDYENKLEFVEKEKGYLKKSLEQHGETIINLQREKNILRDDIQKQKELFEVKLKKAQQEKLNHLIEKNRQIQKMRELVEQMQNKFKQKDFQIKNLEEDKKRIEEKNKELRLEVERGQEKKNLLIRGYEKEMQQLKRKQGNLKKYKQFIKNSQWTTEREIKKGVQSVTKNILNLSAQDHKAGILQMMRGLQTAMVRCALWNLEEL